MANEDNIRTAVEPQGWVKLRRGLMSHLQRGRLNPTEHSALVTLISLASADTGGGTINGPVLRYWLGNAISVRAAQRILRKLHRSGYIWYRGKRKETSTQSYWVNGYLLTQGVKKDCRLNLSQFIDNTRVNQQEIFNSVVGADVGKGVGKDVGADVDPSDDYKNRDLLLDDQDVKPLSDYPNRLDDEAQSGHSTSTPPGHSGHTRATPAPVAPVAPSAPEGTQEKSSSKSKGLPALAEAISRPAAQPAHGASNTPSDTQQAIQEPAAAPEPTVAHPAPVQMPASPKRLKEAGYVFFPSKKMWQSIYGGMDDPDKWVSEAKMKALCEKVGLDYEAERRRK